GDGGAGAEGRPLEADPGQPHDAGGGEIDDGAAAGVIDEADVARAAFRDSVATHPTDAAGPGHDPVARRQLEVTGLDGGAPEPASAPEGRAGNEVEVLRLAGGGSQEEELVARAPLPGPGLEHGGAGGVVCGRS